MAGRPKSRARKSKKAFLKAKYDSAGEYIRFKRARSQAYGPVRPDLQPSWLGVKPKRGYRKAGASRRTDSNSKRRGTFAAKEQLPALRRQLEKAGVDAHSIKHHIWKLTFYNNADGATSEIDLPGGRIGYILTRKKGGKLVTRIEKD